MYHAGHPGFILMWSVKLLLGTTRSAFVYIIRAFVRARVPCCLSHGVEVSYRTVSTSVSPTISFAILPCRPVKRSVAQAEGPPSLIVSRRVASGCNYRAPRVSVRPSPRLLGLPLNLMRMRLADDDVTRAWRVHAPRQPVSFVHLSSI